ncbi:MAG: bifunctional hydroxymethylpyrimidine kinase/phosphomethylpyrimidine kinase [Deltaproteobacteria bacterium]|nr:bifunctional hydroxymethylpyrimidine kinase/phosphomethylpyrimidine kinase [Deltaproteobacteria bacterium]
MKRYVLAVGGSDSSGGAGIQADIRTITSLGAHAFTAATAVTAQNSRGVLVIHRVPARVVLEQIQAVLHDLAPDAVKIGMLLSGTTAREVARVVKRNKLSCVVLDPVLRASTGKALLEPAALSVLKKELLPVVSVVTPNLDEAQRQKSQELEGHGRGLEVYKGYGTRCGDYRRALEQRMRRLILRWKRVSPFSIFEDTDKIYAWNRMRFFLCPGHIPGIGV